MCRAYTELVAGSVASSAEPPELPAHCEEALRHGEFAREKAALAQATHVTHLALLARLLDGNGGRSGMCLGCWPYPSFPLTR